jgi:hypothetical protein
MQVGDLVRLKHRGEKWGVGVLIEPLDDPFGGCWWVHWPNMGRCLQSEHRLEVICK